ncbi:L-lactate dehydrogenase [Paenibacillus cineris]|uniref:L-lactate dehydrogenase 3 n=1 Tax=Paenibacillus cineris TaxID=237530 RepID=A0ABQ4LJV8_9BACL|nr:L-lactate dehydrogenase [Paenibacillus cineris]GIO56263.1 L-lactate dehydrogenase 3 [Paenibacillus cineris]
MKRRKRRVAIVGSGMVGATAAYSMINQSICDEIMMVDRTYDRALAQALDLSHCIDFTHTRTSVYAGTYADCSDMDVVILTAGANPKPGQTRLDVLEEAVLITRQIVTPILKSGFEGIFITAANPVDIVTYLIRQLSGFPRNRVIGTGTSIDTSRKPVLDILSQHKERFKHVDLTDIARKTKDAGWEIYTRKGSTHFGIGSAIAHITRSVLNDEHKIIAVSAILEGEYGEHGVCTGVPAIIHSDGIQEIIELNLNEEERGRFASSCGVIRSNLDKLNLV